MPYQKCPLCDGKGGSSGTAEEPASVCSVCEGKKIIHDSTGKPPLLISNMGETEPTTSQLNPEDIVKPLSVLDELSEEEIGYWSTPYFDELQAKKELRRQELEKEEETA